MNQEHPLYPRLEALAWQKSKPFCYLCYGAAPTGRCVRCGSDDLMRLVDGVGCEYGIEWVIEHLVEANLTPVDIDKAFEDSMVDCYPETVKIGWIEVDTIWAIQQLDSISWDVAKLEWAANEEQDDRLVTFDNGTTYYWMDDVESFLDEQETPPTA